MIDKASSRRRRTAQAQPRQKPKKARAVGERFWYKVLGGSCFAICLPLICSYMPSCRGSSRCAGPFTVLGGKGSKVGSALVQKHFGSQPDALGLATRLAAGRLREAGIVLEPLLRRAGLSVSQINNKDMRIGVASQIMFLELAAQALKDPLLGFRLARDGDLRQMGLLYYAAASSETLGEALDRAQRYSSIVNAGVVLKCFEAGNFTIALRYFGVARHSDRQQMELLVTTLIRVCRALTGRSLTPTVVRLVHRRSGELFRTRKILRVQDRVWCGRRPNHL